MFSWHVLLICCIVLPAHSQAGTSNCTAFSTNGVAESTFQYYRFYDFRNLSGTNLDQKREKASDATQDLKNKTVSDATWMEDWYIRDYPRNSPGTPSISVEFIPDRVYICKTFY